MNRIRIIHLLHQLGIGGAENGVVNLVNHIDADRFATAICAFSKYDFYPERVDERKTKIFNIGKTGGNDLSIPMKLHKILKEWRPHIVHTHAWGTLCEGVIAAKLAKVPIVIHGEHGTIQQKKSNVFVQKIFWRITDQVLSVSKNHRDRLSKTVGFPEHMILDLPNGVDSHRFHHRKMDICTDLPEKNNNIIIGTVGRLEPVKNQELLIRSFAELLQRFRHIKLWIAGGGALKEQLENLADELGAASDILFLGKRDDIPQILNRIDIFVLPSLSEGMSNTILEAMSSGLPVIACRVGGNPELIRDGVTGFLTPSRDQNALSRAVAFLVENEEVRGMMGESARKRIETEFSLTAMVQRYEHLYTRLHHRKCVRSKMNKKEL
jgi:sugar transferase (PEP-CTERM/EpsH1 system associated)